MSSGITKSGMVGILPSRSPWVPSSSTLSRPEASGMIVLSADIWRVNRLDEDICDSSRDSPPRESSDPS